MKYSVDDILLEREERVQFIGELLQRYNMPVVFIRANYPGIDKNNRLTNNIMHYIDLVASDEFRDKIQMKQSKSSAEGPTIIFVLDEDPVEVKKIAIEIEDEHLLGRCVDIDVYNPETLEGISRRDFGISARKCYLCENAAHSCIRSRKHDVTDVIEFINTSFEEFMKSQ
jgi:holo-ACP synthase